VVFLLVATGWNNKLVHLEALESISPVESQQNMFQRSVFAKVLPGLPRFRYSAGGHGNGNEQVVQGVVFTDLSMCEAGSPDDLYRHPFVMTRERVAHGPIYPKLAPVEYAHKRLKTCCLILRDGWECGDLDMEYWNMLMQVRWRAYCKTWESALPTAPEAALMVHGERECADPRRADV